jgi:hypothetical protein
MYKKRIMFLFAIIFSMMSSITYAFTEPDNFEWCPYVSPERVCFDIPTGSSILTSKIVNPTAANSSIGKDTAVFFKLPNDSVMVVNTVYVQNEYITKDDTIFNLPKKFVNEWVHNVYTTLPAGTMLADISYKQILINGYPCVMSASAKKINDSTATIIFDFSFLENGKFTDILFCIPYSPNFTTPSWIVRSMKNIQFE